MQRFSLYLLGAKGVHRHFPRNGLGCLATIARRLYYLAVYKEDGSGVQADIYVESVSDLNFYSSIFIAQL